MPPKKDSTSKKLECPLCDETVEDLVVLPCGQSVCEKCIVNYAEKYSDKDRFNCFLCEKEHKVPKNGFPKSKRIKLFEDAKPDPISRCTLFEKFKQDINSCKEDIERINSLLDNKEEIVKDYYELKRHEIILANESRIVELNKKSRELLDQIDELEKKHLDHLKNNQQQQKEIEADLKKAQGKRDC